MNITIDAAVASIITAVIVGLISALTTIIANRNSFRQQQAQWAREEQRAERDAREAEKRQELELKKADIAKIQEIYGNSIASLTTLLIYTDAAMRLRPDYSENLAEVQKWLSLVVSSHYDKTSEEYKTFLKLYREARDSYKGSESILRLRELMIEFSSKDPRLQS